MADTVFGTRMLVAKSDITQTRLVEIPARALDPGEILFAIRRVALTANNVTYAALGAYRRFFPGPEGSVVVPVWGFGEAVESRAEGIAPGDRFYGYWPLATQLVARTADISPGGFSDPSPHRQGLGYIYNRYTRAVAGRSADDEAFVALFRPLFMTGWLIDRFLADANDFGASQIILSSASSKTALACAFNLARREGARPAIVGLTSAANRGFVESLGSYDRVVTYDAVDTLDAGPPSVYVDFAGDRALTARVHARLGDALKHSAIVGMTHWGERQGDADLPGPAPALFFAPAVAEAMMNAIGPAEFAKANTPAFAAFTPHARGKLAIETRRGMTAAEATYRSLATGQVGGAQAIVVELD